MLELALVILVIALASMTWQHFCYLGIRRNSAQDRQHLLHSADAFHLIVYFKLRNGDKVVDTVRRFVQQILATSKARLIYAGQAAFTINSQQMEKRDWDGVLLFEFPSRSDYQQNFATGADHIRQYFADSYVHGMRRNRQKNLAIPQHLLRLRLRDIVSGKWRVESLNESPLLATFPELAIWQTRAARLRALQAINSNGLVVYSLIKRGNRAQRANYDTYGKMMASRMAALRHGPLHLGRPVALEDFARFDRVFVIHYPSAGYYADLLSSRFFQEIAGRSQLADSLAVFTIPITDRL